MKSSYIFSAPYGSFEPPFKSPFQKLITTVHPIALQRWLMASLVIRVFSSLFPSTQRRLLTFQLCDKDEKDAKTVGLSGNFVYNNVTVKFSPMLNETFGQITTKQQNIKLELDGSCKQLLMAFR